MNALQEKFLEYLQYLLDDPEYGVSKLVHVDADDGWARQSHECAVAAVSLVETARDHLHSDKPQDALKTAIMASERAALAYGFASRMDKNC
jgi:hypothetical protein